MQPDGRTIIATDRDGRTLWEGDMLKDEGVPHAGYPVIRDVTMIDGGLARLTIGKGATVEVDLETGTTRFLGED